LAENNFKQVFYEKHINKHKELNEEISQTSPRSKANEDLVLKNLF
jgi:hypothetical protein